MAQWINIYWNYSFVNLTRLLLLCDKTGTVTLAQLARPWLAGKQADKMLLNLESYIATG